MPRTELRCEVVIDAPAPHVFHVLTDFARYPEWNPFLTSVSGELGEGKKLALEMSLPEGKTYLLEPLVTRLEPNVELRWQSRFWLPSLLEAEHFFSLKDEGERTRVMQGQNFSGALLRFAGGALTLSARGCVYLNQALKKRAEGPASRLGVD